MNLLRWFRRHPRPPRGLQASEAATRWAEARLPEERRAVGAYVAGLLCEQVNLRLTEIEPEHRFVEDLHIDEEAPEIVIAMEQDLGLRIPDADTARMITVADLIEYLHGRLRPSAGPVADPS